MTIYNLSYTHTTVSVGATSTTVLAASTTRRWLLLVNDSDEVMYIKVGAAAVMNAGIRINANGGSFEMSQDLGNLSSAVIYGICASGTKNLLVSYG